MRRGFVLVVVLCATGCVQAAPAASVSLSPSPSASAALSPESSPLPRPPSTFGSSPPPYAVLVRIGGVGEAYLVQLVTGTGLAGPFVTPKSRSEKMYYFPSSPCPSGGMCAGAETAAYNLPEVSISTTRVYFLDGETLIKSLSPDGTVQTVMNVNAPANSQVVFSVSLDDARIAIATITLATTNAAASFNDVMYVEDAGTAAHRLDIYSSTTQAEWPVAWHGGRLIVGVGPSDIGSYDNPYGALGYHVVDAVTGQRYAALDCAQGLLGPAGTACVSGFCPTAGNCGPGTVGAQGFDGTKVRFDLPSGPPPRILTAFADVAQLSPDGSEIALTRLPDDPNQVSDDTFLIRGGTATVLTHVGGPIGWIDTTHLMVAASFQAYIVDTADPSSVLSLVGAESPQIGFATLAGVLPTNLT